MLKLLHGNIVVYYQLKEIVKKLIGMFNPADVRDVGTVGFLQCAPASADRIEELAQLRAENVGKSMN